MTPRRKQSRTHSQEKKESDKSAVSEAAESMGLRKDDRGLYRLLVESVRDYAIFALDSEGYILTWNAGAERLKGYSASEIIGKHFTIFYPEDALLEGKPAWELEVATRDGTVEDEGWRVRKDGTLFWANVVITALRDPTGALVGFAKVTRDLTERRESAEQLRESEERFRLLVSEVRDYAIFMLDPAGKIMSWNEGAERINGYTAAEIIGSHFSTFYPEVDKELGKPAMELEIAAKDGSYEEEGWRIRKSGEQFWANVLISAVVNEAGELVGYAKVTRDLTERRAVQQKLLADARRIAAAESAATTRAEFLTSMSHELRTPINATLGYAELLEMGLGGDVDDQQRDFLARIRKSQEHLLRIINDLLDYSRIKAGEVSYDFAAVDLSILLDELIELVSPQSERKGLTLEVEGCDEPVIARVDRTRLHQVVINLLTNAVKFTEEGGKITVACGKNGPARTLTVSDTGSGIPTDEIDSIFEPFVQLGRTLASGHEGTGMGLAISRDLILGMGGDLTVQSEPGQGTTFRISLPAADSSTTHVAD